MFLQVHRVGGDGRERVTVWGRGRCLVLPANYNWGTRWSSVPSLAGIPVSPLFIGRTKEHLWCCKCSLLHCWHPWSFNKDGIISRIVVQPYWWEYLSKRSGRKSNKRRLLDGKETNMALSPSAWQLDHWATSRVWTAQCVGWQLGSYDQGK